MPFGETLRSAGMLLITPLFAALISQVLGMFAPYLTEGSMLAQTFAAVAEYWLLVAILSLIVNVAAAAIAEGGSI